MSFFGKEERDIFICLTTFGTGWLDLVGQSNSRIANTDFRPTATLSAALTVDNQSTNDSLLNYFFLFVSV